ncbi:uncharacterized protein LOC134212439 [Armigeres subalbatus]|uniref:uncharacterized protein LOC134212439 n=1 Tax=Armigeres subalbatus TaxID=124917 RepID=UPI002ED4A957
MLWYIVLISTLSPVLVDALPEDILLESPENLVTIVPCVKHLCDKYYKSERAIKGSLGLIYLKPDSSLFQINLLKSFHEDPRHEMGIMPKNSRRLHPDASHVTDRAKNYFLMVREASELASHISMFRRLPTLNPLAQVVILFTSEMTPEVFEVEVRKALQKLFDYWFLNVNVMVQRYNTSVLEVWSWFPYENGRCADEIINIRMIDECEYVEIVVDEPEQVDDTREDETFVEYHNETFFNDSSLTFPDSSRNTEWVFREQHFFSEFEPKIPKYFNDCPLKVSTAIWEPFVVGNGTSVEKGFEVLMIEAISARLKLIPVYRIIDGERATARITVNKDIGFYADLIKRQSDIMIGGLYENPISRKLLSSTIPYYQDDLTWCVPPARLAPKWPNVFIIFNIWIWMLAIGIIFVSAGVIAGFNFFEEGYPENYSWMLVQSLALSLGLSATYWPQRLSIRLFLLVYMFYGMHWDVAHHSFLITVMTRPRFEKQISTAEAAIEKAFSFVGPENTLVFFDKPDHVSKHVASVYKTCPDVDDCLARLNSEQSVAVAVSRAHSQNSKTIGEAEMFCFPRTANIQTYPVEMMVKKDFHILPKINDLIRRISESGLLGKWQVESNKIRIDTGSSGGGGGGHGDVQIVLTVAHIEGAFFLVGIGLGISAVAFIGELIYFSLKQKYKWKDTTFSRLIC